MNELAPSTRITSIAAAEQYIALRRENSGRHRAAVLVHANGKDYSPGMRIVYAKVRKSTVEIIIEDLHTIYRDCANRFTEKESSFYLFGQTLQIKSMDYFNRQISIEITGV